MLQSIIIMLSNETLLTCLEGIKKTTQKYSDLLDIFQKILKNIFLKKLKLVFIIMLRKQLQYF